MSLNFNLGDEIKCLLVKQKTEKLWEVFCTVLDKDWTVSLRLKESTLYQVGDEDIFWILEINFEKREVTVGDSDFGRLPISDRMRPRYGQALDAGLKIIGNPKDGLFVSADALSDLKGMFNRCVRQDQWDWFSVYYLLGRPPIAVLRKAAETIGNVARSIRNKDAEQCKELCHEFYNFNLSSMLFVAKKKLIESIPRLQGAIAFKSVAENDEDENAKENVEEQDSYIISQVARAKRERANTSHKQTLDILVKYLSAKGFFVERSRLVDAYCRLKTGPAIFEVKSITVDNERSQCRHALSQLYEYRYLHSIPDASLWVALSSAPHLNWLVEYLQKDRGVNVLWVDDNKLTGERLLTLIESRPK